MLLTTSLLAYINLLIRRIGEINDYEKNIRNNLAVGLQFLSGG